MREIKFRAYEKTLKEIIPVHNIDFQTKIINTNGAWRMFDEIELMQYTGLKDIYEGDIIRVVALSNDHHQKGATSVLVVKFFMGNPCLCFAECETGVPIYTFCVNHTLEVIGNIYENYELLNS